MSPVALWHRLASITWLGWYGVVGWILGPLEIMGLSGWCHRLLGVILRTGGHHCVGGGSNHSCEQTTQKQMRNISHDSSVESSVSFR